MASKPRVLVVDDEPANRRLLADLVARENCDAVVASGGAEALAILAREPFDLVLLDIMMPEVDGMAVLAELQKQGALPALPVVVVTANEERRVRIDALAAGAIDFLTKPIDRIEVACRVRTWIELKQLREGAVRTAEDALRESDHRLRLRFEQSPVATIEWDNDFRVTGWNPAAEKLFGHTRVEALGQHATFVVPEGARLDLDAAWREVMTWAANEETRENVTKDGRTVLCEWFNAPLRTASGTLLGISSVVLDVTERAHLQEALVQSRKMDAIGKLAGGVAHDFNNILAVILSYASFIRDGFPEGDQRRDDANEVLKAGERAVGLTKQLLTFSRQQPTAKKPTDINESLVQIHKLLARSVGEHIELSIIPSARAAVVRIDPVQFDQIVLNLAVNARDAMPDGGRLRIALEHPPGSAPGGADTCQVRHVRLTVTDTGTGMDEPTQRRIFEPFFTTKEKGKGTGLGLATCFGIVEDAGGTLRVKSAPGQGTTFTAELPLCSESVDSPKPDPAIPRAGRGEHVLVAEDEPALRRVVVRVLESAGYKVHAAADGNETLRRIDELGSRLDVIVTDVVMPGCSGYDVATYAARIAPRAAVILTSGYLDEAARRNHREDLPVLWKPVPPRELVRAVAEAISAKTSTRPAATPSTTAKGGMVLLVEDDEVARRAMARVLGGAGYSTQMAATLAAARELLESGPEPQLVLCDLSLPDGSAADLLNWIRSTRPLLCPRVFVLTGGATDEADRRLLESGDFRILRKPIEPERLLEVLAGVREAWRPTPAPAATPKEPSSRSRPPAPSVRSGPPPRKDRVLVVEDDAPFAAASARILDNGGFDVVVAGSLAGARSALAGGAFDALVVDVGLPDGSGFDLLPELRGENSELPVVMITVAPSVESATQALRSRVSEYLPKPFPADELLRVVRAAVEAGRITRLRTKLLAARFGGDEFVGDVPKTEKTFARALQKIRMAFQPIVRSGDGSVFGYEALLRCDEPSLASPLRLLAAAEVLGRVNDVGRAVRATVAATMVEHRDQLEAIFVNIHPSELRADLLAEATDPLMPLAHRVVLEVTERASLEGGAKLDEDLLRIRDLGYRLAVDDLGEGYAGLSSLVNLRPDIAKIDMSLVRDVHRAPLKRDIIAALVDMARRSGIVVVAEGVETTDERDTLVDLGCDLLQGYLFAKPGPPFPVPRTTWEVGG